MILVTQSGDKVVNMDYIREVFVYTKGKEKQRHALIARHNLRWTGSNNEEV